MDHTTSLGERIGRFRWTICALLFFAATINYIDRQVIGILKPTLKAELGWDEIAYSNVVFWFQAAYAMGFIIMGRLMDKLGTRVVSPSRLFSGAWQQWPMRSPIR